MIDLQQFSRLTQAGLRCARVFLLIANSERVDPAMRVKEKVCDGQREPSRTFIIWPPNRVHQLKTSD
ncbi:hypothetical protein [Paraburkholderia hospita]|uniref:hypothetical protein n=1 Tax=Paraburkholderia hospita TaxID=169430 RepID=UPI001054E9ED|nr:hypothetical protein [Paraburkholderia hospita]